MKLGRQFNILFVISMAISCATNPTRSPQSVESVKVNFDLTLEKLAEEMSLTPEALVENTLLLTQYLEEKASFESICPEQKPKEREGLCDYLADVEERPLEKPSKNHERPVRLTIKNLDENQSLPYVKATRAVSRINKKTMKIWVTNLLARTACPRNLSAAALRKLEENLPDPDTIQQMETLYTHASECLKPADPGFETLHFRQALLRRMYGNNEGARTSLEFAAKAENPEEKGRVLYWLGILANEDSKRKDIWEDLTEKQPMTYHSLLVWKSLNQDPFKSFSDRPEKPILRVTPDLSGRSRKSIQWLESLYFAKQPFAAEKLTRWISSDSSDLSADAVIYLGALKNSHDQHHNAIKFLTESVVRNPELLSAQLLKQLYPVPYLESFYRLSEGVDTFLVMGLARQESAFNPLARSPAKAEGMMQVLPRVARIKMNTHKRVNLFDVEINIKVGSRLLRDWIRQFGAVEYALIAYNAGPLRINEWKKRYPTDDMALFLDLIPFKETRNYVSSILRNNYWYHRLYENDPTYKALLLQHPEVEGSSFYSQLVRDMIVAHTPKN